MKSVFYRSGADIRPCRVCAVLCASVAGVIRTRGDRYAHATASGANALSAFRSSDRLLESNCACLIVARV